MKKIIFISLSLILLSCSKYQKVLKSTDFSMKYDKAIEFYNKHDAEKAVNQLRKNGLLTTITKNSIIRMCPPLIINQYQMSESLDIIKKSLN